MNSFEKHIAALNVPGECSSFIVPASGYIQVRSDPGNAKIPACAGMTIARQ
jgi:hypothetical protein